MQTTLAILQRATAQMLTRSSNQHKNFCLLKAQYYGTVLMKFPDTPFLFLVWKLNTNVELIEFISSKEVFITLLMYAR
jgi:hypothetical protein